MVQEKIHAKSLKNTMKHKFYITDNNYNQVGIWNLILLSTLYKKIKERILEWLSWTLGNGHILPHFSSMSFHGGKFCQMQVLHLTPLKLMLLFELMHPSNRFCLVSLVLNPILMKIPILFMIKLVAI